jgi:hypothetical protein
MGVVIIGIVAAILLAIGAGAYLTSEQQRPAWEAYSTSSTRVGDPGFNLVGKKWTGEPTKSDVIAEEKSS